VDQNIWYYFHDGLVVSIAGRVPGDVVFTIAILYIRERFLSEGEAIIVTLKNCTVLDFLSVDDGLLMEGSPFFSIEEEEKAFEILGRELKGEYEELFCELPYSPSSEYDYRLLRLKYDNFLLHLDDGTLITLDELVQAWNGYWKSFGTHTKPASQGLHS
jgi:hypothetical protein